MSWEPQPTSPICSVFRRHNHHASSSDSYYSCDDASGHQFVRARSPSHSAFQPLPSAHHPPYLSPHILSNEQFNFSQSSLGHSSSYHSSTSQTRYLEPYTGKSFLPLGELRHRRSSGLLTKLSPLTSATLFRRKPPSTLSPNDTDPNFTVPVAVVANRQVNAPQGRVPERSTVQPIAQIFTAPSQSSLANRGSSESDLTSAYTCHTSPPAELYPAASVPADPRLTDITPAESSRTMGGVEGCTADVTDVGSALRWIVGTSLRVDEIKTRRVSISEGPGCNEVDSLVSGTREQNVACEQMEGSLVGKTGSSVAKSQIPADPYQTPTNELEQIPWPSVYTLPTSVLRKRPPPIYVGNQVRRSTMTQTGMAAATRSNEENVALEVDSPTSIKSAGFTSRKPSDASQFSLSMFPPTPTTPIHGDIVWARLNRNSPLRQGFSPTHEALSAPPTGLALSSSPQSLQPPPSPHYHCFASNTLVRRATTETGHQSHLAYTQNHTKHPSADPPAHYGRNRAGSLTSPEPSRHSLGVISLYQGPFNPVAPEQRQERYRKRSDTVTSSGSDSVYSQDQDSGSCYSDDDAASMTSSVEEAIMMAREERRFSRQSRLAYMRDAGVAESSQELSLQSHASSSSSSGSPEQSASLVAPDELGKYLIEEGKTAISLVRLERPNARLPTVDIIPPGRKPQLRMSTNSKSTMRNLPRAIPEPKLKPLRPSPSMFSLRSRGTRKSRPPEMIMISHPHLNADDTLGAEVLPQGADIGASRVTLTTDGGVGVHSIAHSKSMPALRTPCSVSRNVPEKKHKEREPFDKCGMPSGEQLRLASEMNVYDDRGQPVRFGDIFEGQKTAICFIRHFWCPLCQDYMSSIVHLTEPSFVEKAGVKLVIIGNGSPSMIKAYRDNIFHCPYEMYTDPSRQVYNALGMNLRTTNGGCKEEKGSYVKHGTFTGTMMVLKNALKMPIANAGDVKQLGGEFVLGPGLTCSFTSRMHTTRSHTPIRDLLQAAGVDTNPWATDLSFLRSEADWARWMDIQNEDLDRLVRRGLQAGCGERYCTLGDDVDGTGQLDLGEFRRLLECLKGGVAVSISKLEPEPEPKPEPVRPAPVAGPSYEIEVKGGKRIELDHLGAVLQSRNESSTWEAPRDRKRGTSRPGTATSRPGTATSRPGTAASRPGTATSRPGTAKSTVSFGRA